MTAFDYLVLGILVVSAALGLFRGLIKEVLSLVAYIAAFVLTIWLAPKLSLGLEGWVVNDLLRLAIAYASVFALALLALGLINLFLSRLVDLTGLGTADHALGALFGVLRGAVFVIVLVVLAGYTELPLEPWWQDARLSNACVQAVQQLKQFVPQDVAQLLPY